MPPITYAQVRSERIDVDAQRSLMRKPDPVAQEIVRDFHAGHLYGIFAEDQKAPALRAAFWVEGWWNLIPRGEDAVVVLDPKGGKPLIAFRRTIRNDPARLDAALRKAHATFRVVHEGRFGNCLGADVSPAPLTDLVPRGFCHRRLPTPLTVSCDCGSGLNLFELRINGFIPGTRAVREGSTNRGLVPDGRSFDSRRHPPSRFSSRVELFFPSRTFVERHAPPASDTIVSLAGGGILCGPRVSPAVVIAFTNQRTVAKEGFFEIHLDYVARVPNACTAAPFTITADAHILITFLAGQPQSISVEITEGRSNVFAIEAYALTNLCDPVPVVQQVLNLPTTTSDVTTKAFGGEARLRCEVAA